VICGLLAGFALSPKLWLSSRSYPLTPVWSFLRPLPRPDDSIVFFALIVLLFAASVAPRREILIALFALLALVALQDQSRWQPWFYQYVVMLLAIALAGPERESEALDTCCLIVAATYLWSGLAKLNPNFTGTTFPRLVSPLVGTLPSPVVWFILRLAFVAPLIECGAGIGLLFRRWRTAAVCGAIAMHIFVLVTIGPLGLRSNSVVWPWNLAMIAFLLILFLRRAGEPAARDIVWGRGFAFQKIVLILFGFMPALTYFNLWDHYLSSALYSGNRTTGFVYVSDDVFDRLPDTIEDYVHEDQPDHSRLNLDEWSMGEMNVPTYPETRIYRNVARHICGYAIGGAGVELIVQGKLALVNSGRRSAVNCAGLQPNLRR
jgi:hypothetical protein